MGFFSNLKRTVKGTVKSLANPKALATMALVVATGGVASAMVAGSSFSAAFATLGTSSFWSAAAIRTGVTLGLGAVYSALQPQPDNSGGRSIQDLGAQGTRFQFRSPTAPREVVYGQTKKSGAIVFIGTSSSTGATGNEFLHMVIAISAAKSDSAYRVYLNDTIVAEDLSASDGFVSADSGTTPDYSAKVKVQWKDGGYPQTSLTENSGTNTNPPGWQSSYRLDGISYLYVRMQYDATLFEAGIPNVSVIVKGKPVYDPRTFSTAYSSNPALCIRDYLLDTDYGLGCHPDEIDEDSFETAADVCDENSNQYELHGVVDTSKSPKAIITDMLTSCSGMLSYSNGKFYMRAAKYIAPTITVTEDDLTGPVSVQATNSMRDQFNTVKAIYYNLGLDQVTDMPVQEETDLLFLDNGQKTSVDLSLPFTTSEAKAIKLAELALYRARNQMTINLPLNLKKFNIQIGDNITLTYPRLGFSSKIFEVVEWSFGFNGEDLSVNVNLKENSADSYSGGTALTQDIRTITKNDLVGWDVSDTFDSAYSASTDKVLIIERGVNIYGQPQTSSVSSSEALIIPAGLGGTLTIRNYGNIYGYSGAYNDLYASNDGGDAIFIASGVASQVTIVNDGTIAGGGGSGSVGGRSAYATYWPDQYISIDVGGYGPVDGGDGAGWDGTQLILPDSPLNLGEDAIDYPGSPITSYYGNAITVGSSGAGGDGGGFGEDGEVGGDGGDSTNEENRNMTPPLPIREGFDVVDDYLAAFQAGSGGNAITNGTNSEVLNRASIYGNIT